MPSQKAAQKLAVLRDMGDFPEPPRSPDWEKSEIKTYEGGFVYIVDHGLDDYQLPNHTAKQQQHAERCKRVGHFFDSRTPYQVEYVNLPRGSTLDDWSSYWNEELASKTEDDLLIIYFQGEAYGTNQEYKWKLQGGLQINAHSFITQINRGVSDCAFFLDCCFHTRMTRGLKWKLNNNSMLEFITTPLPVSNSRGAIVDHEGDWSKAFPRDMQNFAEGEIQVPSWTAPLKSIPQVMQRDHEIYYNQGSRFKVRRAEKDRRTVRRLVVDPVMVWSTGEYQFFGQVLRSKNKVIETESESESEDEEEPVDEGFDGEWNAAAQFVEDQLNREADIADGF